MQEITFPQISFDAYRTIQEAEGEANEGETNRQRHATASNEHIQFWVEKTYAAGKPDRLSGDFALGEVLWSPQAGSDGRDTYRLMRGNVKPGDLVFHLINNQEIAGVSSVTKEYDDTYVAPQGTEWEGDPIYLIRLEKFTKFAYPIRRSEFLDTPKYRQQLLELVSNHNSLFFNRNLQLRQGAYLTIAPVQLLKIWDEIYYQKTGNHLPLIDTNLVSTLVATTTGAFSVEVRHRAR